VHEQPHAQVGLLILNPSAGGRLGDVQPFGRIKEAAVGGNREEGASLLYVLVGKTQSLVSKISIISSYKYRLSNILCPDRMFFPLKTNDRRP
jgi:hypothetical protein